MDASAQMARHLTDSLRRTAPGLSFGAILAVVSILLARQFGGPFVLYALLLGMLARFGAQARMLQTGLAFAARTLLRLAVALLGVRITFGDMLAFGPAPLLAVGAATPLSIAFGLWMARRLRLPWETGAVSSIAVSICGVSAAVAAASVLPNRPHAERDLAVATLGVTTLSTVAMLLYPVIVVSLDLGSLAGGLFLGASIHDVAQVVGAGAMLSTDAGVVATFTKLLRIALLAPTIMWLAAVAARRAASADKAGMRNGAALGLPWFVIGFFSLAGVNSAGFLPQATVQSLSDASAILLTVAIAAIGARTSVRDLMSAGWRPLALLILNTLWLAGLALTFALLARGLSS